MKRALIIGIDHYEGAPLYGCVADAVAISDALSRHQSGDPNYDVQLHTSEHETIDRPRLRGLLSQLFDNAAGAELVFYFAGHGAETNWGGELVTQGFQPQSLGVSMDDIITLANTSPAREVLLILDCCHSGHLGNIAALQAGAVSPQFRLATAVLREGVTILSASRGTQPFGRERRPRRRSRVSSWKDSMARRETSSGMSRRSRCTRSPPERSVAGNNARSSSRTCLSRRYFGSARPGSIRPCFAAFRTSSPMPPSGSP